MLSRRRLSQALGGTRGSASLNGRQLRQTVLEVVRELAERNSHLQSASVLQEAARRLGIRGVEQEQALLAFFGDLFRIGYLAWGYNLSNPAPPFCHITATGRAALATFSRDPSNPDGYLANLHSGGNLNPIAESYIREGLATYVAGCFKATAVMVGAAAESVVLALRDAVGSKLDSLGRPRPADLDDWRIKRVLDSLETLLIAQKPTMPRPLFEAFESYWPAFTQQVRAARNAAGHPSSVEPVEEPTVQASLLIFPELVKLETELEAWVASSYA